MLELILGSGAIITVLIIILAIVIAIAPLIIVFQLKEIKRLQRIANENQKLQHQELLNALYSFRINDTTQQNTKIQHENRENRDNRDREIMKSLFQDEKNTSDQ